LGKIDGRGQKSTFIYASESSAGEIFEGEDNGKIKTFGRKRKDRTCGEKKVVFMEARCVLGRMELSESAQDKNQRRRRFSRKEGKSEKGKKSK